jgi:tripartite-type tricarboxylate transporter receptor subunit TctC
LAPKRFMKTRNFIRAIVRSIAGLAIASIGCLVHSAYAQTYPNKPIKILVGYSAGGAVDLIARSIGLQLQTLLGQPVVIENKPGAGSNIATRAMIDGPADGYTLMMAANAVAANVTLFQPAPFDLEKDIAAVSLVGRVPVVIAAPANSELDTLAKIVDAAKKKPNSITYGSPGNGATPHLALELFERAAGISLTHVPYKGGSQAITDAIGGQVNLVAVNALEVQPHVKSGRLKVVAVMSRNRSALMPDVPSIAESGFAGFEASVWYGLIAPAATPKPIVARLHAEVQKALESQEVKTRLTSAGGEVLPASIEQFSSLLTSEKTRYERVIKQAGIKPD